MTIKVLVYKSSTYQDKKTMEFCDAEAMLTYGLGQIENVIITKYVSEEDDDPDKDTVYEMELWDEA